MAEVTVDVTKLLVPLMVALIESSPSLVALLGKEWALFRGRARKADDSQFPYGTKLDYVTVLLKKSETGWQIVDRSMPILYGSDMLIRIDDLSDLQKKFPKAPALLFPPGVPVF